jgi:hypothetical protein
MCEDRAVQRRGANIVAQGLTSEAARSFLEQLPAIETLMPPLEVGKIEGMLRRMDQPKVHHSGELWAADRDRYFSWAWSPAPLKADAAANNAAPRSSQPAAAWPTKPLSGKRF